LPEVLAGLAVVHVELVADDRKPHGMGAVQQLTVLNGVEPDVGRNLRRPPSVPAGAMARFRFGHEAALATSPAEERIRVVTRRPLRRRNLPYVGRPVPALPSATASVGTR